MSDALRHRGCGPWVYDESQYGTLGYLPRFNDTHACPTQAGLHVDGDVSIGLANPLFVNPCANTSPDDLIRLYREQGPTFVESLCGGFIVVVRDKHTIRLVRNPDD